MHFFDPDNSNLVARGPGPGADFAGLAGPDDAPRLAEALRGGTFPEILATASIPNLESAA